MNVYSTASNERGMTQVRKATGFTLIELLVVIAIIAILAAILFPVFARAREKARSASCLSNCKQMGLAAMMYSQDYDEMVAPGRIWDYSGTWRHEYWPTLLQAYANNTQIFLCPSGNKQAGYQVCAPGKVLRWADPSTWFWVNYGANFDIMRCSYWWNSQMLSLPQMAYPAETVMIADCDWTQSTEDYSGSMSWYFRYPHWHPACFIPARHNGGANLVFADGHAKWWTLGLNDIYVGPVKFTHMPSDLCFLPNGSPKY